MVVHSAVGGVGGRTLLQNLLRRHARHFHDLGREGTQLNPALDKAPEGGRVLGVVPGLDAVRGRTHRHPESLLVRGGQRVPGGLVHLEGGRGSRLPPAWVVVEPRGILESQLLVVVGTHPLDGVDRSPFERRIDLARREILHGHAQAVHYLRTQPGDAHLEPAKVLGSVDFAAEPATHLRAGVACREWQDVEVREGFADELEPARVVQPGVLLARVEPEGHAGVESQHRRLARVVVARAVAHLNGALLHRVHDLQPGNQLARLVDPDLETPVGHRCQRLGGAGGGVEDGVHGARIAGRQTPANVRVGDHLRSTVTAARFLRAAA